MSILNSLLLYYSTRRTNKIRKGGYILQSSWTVLEENIGGQRQKDGDLF